MLRRGAWNYVPYLFFFQAEDGIRDVAVTGVQTCALPILAGASSARRLTLGGRNRVPVWSADGERVAFQSDRDGDLGQIGRASCRERVWMSVVAAAVK